MTTPAVHTLQLFLLAKGSLANQPSDQVKLWDGFNIISFKVVNKERGLGMVSSQKTD